MKIWHLHFNDEYNSYNGHSNHFYAEDNPPSTEDIKEKFLDWYGGEPLFRPIEDYYSLKLVKVNKR